MVSLLRNVVSLLGVALHGKGSVIGVRTRHVDTSLKTLVIGGSKDPAQQALRIKAAQDKRAKRAAKAVKEGR